MINLFLVLEVPIVRLLELVLLAMVIFIFIGRLIIVSAYQHRTSDYFDILLIAWYAIPETTQALDKSRQRVIALANVLAKIMWLCGVLLSLTYITEQYFIK